MKILVINAGSSSLKFQLFDMSNEKVIAKGNCEKIGLESLPEDLQEVAVLRLANQEESLDELLKLSTLKLTKSGLNHRFRRILKIAQLLKGE